MIVDIIASKNIVLYINVYLYLCSVQVYVVIRYSVLKNPEPNLTHANGCPTTSQISSHPHLPAFVSKFPRRVKILICTTRPYQSDIGFFAKNLYNYLIDADVRLFPQLTAMPPQPSRKMT